MYHNDLIFREKPWSLVWEEENEVVDDDGDPDWEDEAIPSPWDLLINDEESDDAGFDGDTESAKKKNVNGAIKPKATSSNNNNSQATASTSSSDQSKAHSSNHDDKKDDINNNMNL